MSTSIQIISSNWCFSALNWNVAIYTISKGLHRFAEAFFCFGRKSKSLAIELLVFDEIHKTDEIDFKEKQKFPLNFERPIIKHQVTDRRPKLVKIIYR